MTEPPVRPPEPLLAPAVEARIREIVRELLPEITAAMDGHLAVSLQRTIPPSHSTHIDKHQIVTGVAPKRLGE
jgi:hypothetical protein